jgi:hypothetical protein
MKHLEDKEQISLMAWVRSIQHIYPLLSLVYHTPNGGYRDPRNAAKLRAMGVKPGVWDLFVPAPSPSLWVEMKHGKNKLTVHQKDWREALEPYGYKFVVCYTWQEAAHAIAEHIGVAEEHRP